MKYIQGDLIQLFKQGEFDLIAHQCNCKGLFGAGIARLLAKEFPVIAYEVESHFKAVTLYGTNIAFETEHGFIINMYSQFNVGDCNKIGIDSFIVRLAALKGCLININTYYRGLTVGLPLIASGLAADQIRKGTMPDLEYFQKYIESTVEESLPDMDVKIVYQ